MLPTIPLHLLVLLLAFAMITRQSAMVGARDLSQLSSSQISALISNPDPLNNLLPSNPSSHLSKILIPRAPDTENNTLVRTYITSVLRSLNWDVEEDPFHATTPIGEKRFTNIIATKDPTASRRVILSAHFDSKYFAKYPYNQFLGATDSAASCAIMLDLAEALNPLLDARKERLENGLEDDEDVSDTTLQLVFFDGEEAFFDWSNTDSIYGARHLAEKWSSTTVPHHPKRRLLFPTAQTSLSTIEHLILLDLIGAPSPTIHSYFLDTAWLFDALIFVENRLRKVDVELKDIKQDDWRSFFMPRRARDVNMGYIGDDHVPFLQKGVSVLHVISSPFPRVWHTLDDDADALDMPTMRRWNLIFRVFMAEYLHLRPHSIRETSSQRSESDL